MDRLRAGVSALMIDLGKRVKDGRIDPTVWAAITPKLLKTSEDEVPDPERKGVWYELFGFGDQSNATKYLGGPRARATKRIQSTHIEAIYRVVDMLRVSPLSPPPTSPTAWVEWVESLLQGSRLTAKNQTIRNSLLAFPAVRNTVDTLSANGIACIVGRDANERGEMARLIASYLLADAPVVVDQSRKIPRQVLLADIGALCAHILTRVAAAIRRRALTKGVFETAYSNFRFKWERQMRGVDPGRLDQTNNAKFYAGFRDRLSWNEFVTHIRTQAHGLERLDLLHDLAEVLRLGADGVVVVLENAFELEGGLPFLKALFLRDGERTNGPSLLVTCEVAGALRLLSAELDTDAIDMSAALESRSTGSTAAKQTAKSSESASETKTPQSTSDEVSDVDRFFSSTEEYVDYLGGREMDGRMSGLWLISVLIHPNVVRSVLSLEWPHPTYYHPDDGPPLRKAIEFEWFHQSTDRRRNSLKAVMTGRAFLRGRILQFITPKGRVFMRWELGELLQSTEGVIMGQIRSQFDGYPVSYPADKDVEYHHVKARYLHPNTIAPDDWRTSLTAALAKEPTQTSVEIWPIYLRRDWI